MPATASVAIKTLFAPFDPVEDEFLAFVNSATTSLHIVIYGYHLPLLGDAIIAKHQAGLNVSIILDHTQAEGRAEAPEVQRLVDASVPLLVGTSTIHRAIIHSKFVVVDGAAVEYGSWNFSIGASQQSNFASFVHDPSYATAFLRHHDQLVSFIKLHEMAMQPKGASPAPLALVPSPDQEEDAA